MTNRKATLTGLMVAAVAVTGGCSDRPPTEPLGLDQEVSLFGATARDPAGFSGGLDAQFVRLAQEYPGFGGYFYGEDGTLNIYLAGVQTLPARLGGSLQHMGVELTAQPVNVLPAQYDFAELAQMRARVNSLFSIRGVVFTDADEARNRVHVGVTDERVRSDVERGLAMLDVPREAVIISITDPIEPLQTLQSRVRPVAGGLQIWRFIPPGTAGICTLGFNVRSPAGPVQGFVTNSHCTEQRGVVTGTVWSQKEIALPVEPIGTEVHDLPFFTGGACPPGRMCRWSDTAGGVYQPGVANAFGQIYRTLFPGTAAPGSLTIDPTNPRWTIAAERPYPNVGDTMHKTGRTTGWTTGPVAATCVDTDVTGTDITMLCQEWVSALSASGDSGSPVFRRIGETNDVELNGILWGGGGGFFVFSAMDVIRFENRGPAPWITFPGQTPPAP